MVLTPTYHVFDLYKVHQGATLLHSSVSCGCDEASGLPLVQESASRAADGSLSTTLCNPSASEAVEMETVVTGCEMELAEALVLAGEIHAHNDFETGSPVQIQALSGVAVAHEGGNTVLRFTLPPCSAARLTLR